MKVEAGPPSAGTAARSATVESQRDSGRWLLIGVSVVVLAVVTPVLVNAAPLADEYHLCLRPLRDGGYDAYLADIWSDTGVVRPARFIELVLVSQLCHRVPFGLIVLVPLALKFAAAGLLYGLLRDLRLPGPWPAIGAAVWLLEPLGAEATLWPAALHVHLGLAFALGALRLYRRGATGWAVAATLAACLSVEQVIFAFPLAVWLACPPQERRRATLAAAVTVAVVIVAYAAFPGDNERQALTLADRLGYALAKREWYVLFPAAGLGLHSGALALWWAFPASVAAIGLAALGGWKAGPGLLRDTTPQGLHRRAALHLAAALGGLAVLVNLPLIVTEVGYSGRTFTPTWLVVAAGLAVAGSRVRCRPQVLGAAAGAAAAVAVLSLALSVSVRVATVAFNEAAFAWLAEQVDDGDVVAVCDVQRTAVNPAPLGAFHLHEFHSEYGGAMEYHTGRVVEMRRGGERYWGSRCPDLSGAAVVVDFDQLLEAAERAR